MRRQQRKPKDDKWDHTEFRDKVTLSDFYAARLNAIEIPYGSIENAYLMGAPVHFERPKLHERIKLTNGRLNTSARKFTTLLPESFWGSTARKLAEPEPPLEQRLREISGHLFTRMTKATVKVPVTADCMADYIEKFDRLNGLRPIQESTEAA